MTIDKIQDFITFPKTFESYRWYKPILILIITLIVTAILQGIMTYVLYQTFGLDLLKSIFSGRYESLSSAETIFLTDMYIIFIIPGLYIASKIVRDRPFSSYSSSRGGWNFKLYFKALAIPLILFIAFQAVDAFIKGTKGPSNFSIAFLLVLLISVPLQSIAEEYLFRGWLMQTLGSWFGIPVLAMVLQSVIFAIFHGYNTIGLVEMFAMGLVFGFLSWKTNGIEVCSAMHTASNFSVGLFVMLGLHKSTSNIEFTSGLLSTIIIILIGAIIYYVGEKTNWFGELPENSQNA